MALWRPSGLLRKRVAAITAASIVASGLTLAAAPPASAALPGLATLTLTASPGLIQWGQSATVAGTLTFNPPATTVGELVTLSMTPPGGVKAQIDVITLTAAGTFSVSSAGLRTPGTYTFTADYAGSITEGAASTAATTVLTVVKLSTSAKIVGFKRRLLVTVHLDNYKQTSNHRVALWDAPYPRTTFKRVALRKVAVTGKGKGNAVFEVKPGRLTVFLGSWWVSSPEAVASNLVWVHVRARVVPDIHYFIQGNSSFRRQSGMYYLFYPPPCLLYPWGWIGCLNFRAGVSPKRGGSALCFKVQHSIGSSWKTDSDTCSSLGKGSRATVQLAEKGPLGAVRRVMAYFPSDGVMARGDSPWVYYQFIGFVT